MIVPASAVSTDRYKPLRHLLNASGRMVVSSYGDNPGKLFDGMPHNRLQIVLVQREIRLQTPCLLATTNGDPALGTIYSRPYASLSRPTS